MSQPHFGRIVVDPKIHFGQPYIKGTSIPVYGVLDLLAEKRSFKEIISDYYPDLTPDDLKACVEYAGALAREEKTDRSWFSSVFGGKRS